MRRRRRDPDEPFEVSCDGCGREMKNTRHPDLDGGERSDYCSRACLEGRARGRPGRSATQVLANGGESCGR
jgi:hypothetical protein